MARRGRERGERSGVRPESYRCSKTADGGGLGGSCLSWTQFYAAGFSPSNRYRLSRQAHAQQLNQTDAGRINDAGIGLLSVCEVVS